MSLRSIALVMVPLFSCVASAQERKVNWGIVESREATDRLTADLRVEYVRYSLSVPQFVHVSDGGIRFEDDPDVHYSVFAFDKTQVTKAGPLFAKPDGLVLFLKQSAPGLRVTAPPKKNGDTTVVVSEGRGALGTEELTVASSRLVRDVYVIAVFTAPLSRRAEYAQLLSRMNDSFKATWSGVEE